MNALSSQQRKLVYLVLIVLLSIPIAILGMPASGTDGGGRIAELRREHSLGETQLGQVDPTSSAMNLVLLGFRGIAADLLWIQAVDNQDTKDWAQLKSNLDAIILLQPNFVKVWQHQGWNLAYNVSAAWDLVADRYYWVKEGAKFLVRGTKVNARSPELPYDTGRTLGTKIGRADEWKSYREFFRKDPNEDLFHGRPDPEVNPADKDNYLAAKDMYLKANDVESIHGQHGMLKVLFRQYPWRSQLSYADALNREGNFGESSQVGWEDAYREWTTIYGQEEFETPSGKIRLEWSPKDVEEQAGLQNVEAEALQRAFTSLHNTTRYTYWKTRALVEAKQLTIDAHKAIYDGQKLFRDAKLKDASERLFQGMTFYQQLLEQYPILIGEDDEAIEEGLNAILYWQSIYKLQAEPLPEQYPLLGLWQKNQHRIPELEARFNRDNSLQK